MKRPTSFLTLLFLWVFQPIFAQDSDVNLIQAQIESLNITKIYVYSEKSNAISLSNLLEDETVFEFQEKNLTNQGIGKKYHWLKVKLKNESNETNFIYEFNQTNIDSLRFYQVKNQEIVYALPTKGLHFPKNNVSSFLSNKYAYIYPLTLKQGEETTIYIRADVNDDPFRVMNKLWTKEAYKQRENDIKIRSSYMLIFSGFVILICFLSLAMYAFTRQRLYLYYMGFVLVIFINLIALRHFISPVIIERYLFFGNNFSEMFGYLQLFFVLLYTNHFFELDVHYPKVYQVFRWSAVFTAVLFIAALFLRKYEWFFHFSYIFSKFFLAAVSMGLYFFAVYLAFKRKIMAYYYVIAYFPLFLFVGHFILTAMKLTNSYNPLEWEYVIFIEIIVLTIAMAHRYYLIMKENSNYQIALIREQERGIHAMIDAQETERTRIAKDLHDGVVQQIASVILKSRQAFNTLNIVKSTEATEILEKLENANQDLRSISHKMMPRSLQELGITAAMSDMFAASLPQAKIDYTFEHFNLKERLTPQIEVNLYRVAQELVNNIIKHSEAQEVSVQLYIADNAVIFRVEDNGIGMPKVEKKEGVGLLNIKNRVEMLKGSVHFEQGSESGTLTTIKIPLYAD